MDKEIWKDIPGYEGKYQASTYGRIRSIDHKVRGKCRFTGEEFYRTVKGRVLRPAKFSKCGHISVVLGHGANSSSVHQLVARTLLGECPEGFEVLHNNGNSSDNSVENLRYGTRTENILDVYLTGGRWRKLSIEDVQGIRFGFFCGYTGRELADMYDVSQQTISKIKNGRTYAWLK